MRSAEHLATFMELLNEEVAIGSAAADALLAVPAQERSSLLARHPEWLRTGTFDMLLAKAREEMSRSAFVAEEITSFVLEHVLLCRQQPGGEVLLILVRGTAHKDHASALYRRGEGEEHLAAALRHIEEAFRIFSERPALFLERANVRFVQAQIYQALGEFTAALAVLEECEQVFADNGDAYRYLQVLMQRGFCHFQIAERARAGAATASYRQARTGFEDALAEAERIGEQRERARILSNLGHTVLQLNEPSTARDYFEQGARAFLALEMTADLQHALWGLAELEAIHGDHHRAKKLLEEIEAEFVARGMFADAALIRFDLTVRLADRLQDARMAQEACAALVNGPGIGELSAGMRDAIAYLAGASSPTLEDLTKTVAFLDRYETDAAATFERPGA